MHRNPTLDLHITAAQARIALTPVFRRYGVQMAILFGSVARGEGSKHSDVDLILIQETDKRFLDRYTPILHDLNCALPGHPVEPLIYTPEEFDVMRETAFISKLLAHGITIYESDKE